MTQDYYERKQDRGKLRWDLIRLQWVQPLVVILTYGLHKYGRANSWQTVQNGEERYYAALLRHLEAYQRGEVYDEESGYPHIWHALCNLFFMVWFHDKRIAKRKYYKGGSKCTK